MAGRFRGPIQGITPRRLIGGVIPLAVVLVAGAGPALAQAPGAAPAPQPPPFSEPAEKFAGRPLVETLPPPPSRDGPPPQEPTPPKWPGHPLGAVGQEPPPLSPPPPAVNPPASAYPPPPPVAGGPVPSLSAQGAPPAPAAHEPVVDPQADRVLLLPTATTHPAGTFYVSNYELVIFQAGYAFTDATQVSLTAIPAPSESLTILDVSVKSSLYRGGLVRAAGIGSVSGAAGKEIGLQLVGRAGGVVQVCTARRCDSSLSLSSNVLFAGALLIMVNGAGGIWRMSEHVSVLAELATMVPVGSQGGQFNGAALGGGVRLHYAHWGFDFGAMHALDSTADVSTIPFVAMTWRP